MNKTLACVFLLSLLAAACSKPTQVSIIPPTPPAATDTLSDQRSVLLKEVNLEHLPSPYFKLTYNDSNFVTNISFASHLINWQLQYENKRLKRMTNTATGDDMVYSYLDGRVAFIKHISATTGEPVWHYDFTYNNNSQLKQVRWWHFPTDGGDSTLERKVLLEYAADGNLSRYEDFRRDTLQDVSLTTTVEFKDYDQGVNVDDFFLLKDFFDDLLFLPQVKLQKNNPRQLLWHNPNNDYTFNYSYHYDSNNLPLETNYTFLVNIGTDAGSEFSGTNRFSYY